MRRGVIIVLAGFLLLVITGIVWFVFSSGILGGGDEGEQPATNIPVEPLEEILQTQQPEPVLETTQIVVAVQNIGRGMYLTEDAVTLWDWPLETLPPDAIVGNMEQDRNADGVPDAIEQVLGKRMRINTDRFEPILEPMLADDDDLVGSGSDAALAIPGGRVLIAIPVADVSDDPTTVAGYVLRKGDHIDVLISMALIDLDEEFSTKLPNQTMRLEIREGAEGETTLELQEFPYGRFEEGPLGLIFNVIPSEDNQRSRLVTQLMVQDAVVVRVGRYPTYEEEIRGIDPQAPPTPTPVPEDADEQAQQTAPPPPPKPKVILLSVTPQEALVLKFASEIDANLDFVLRSVGDQAIYQTNAVTLQYLMETYNIAIPPKLQYGLEEPVTVESLVDDTTTQ
jgi:pilus assembly protein CpaB